VGITVGLNLTPWFPVEVDYMVRDGTAHQPDDYRTTNGTLRFAPGIDTQVITITIQSDIEQEEDETVLLILSAPRGAHLGEPDNAILTITNARLNLLALPFILHEQ
jgi:hypothetical protein